MSSGTDLWLVMKLTRFYFDNCSFGKWYLGGVRPEDFYHDEQRALFKIGDASTISDDIWDCILSRKKANIKHPECRICLDAGELY